MGQLYKGRVIRMPLGSMACEAKAPLLEAALSSIVGVSAFFINCEEGVLTAYVDDIGADETSLVRALVASGMYPMEDFNWSVRSEGDSRAC